MSLRKIALASAALLVCGGPAFAGQGFYLGLAAGSTVESNTKWKFPDFPGTSGRIDVDRSVLFSGSAGFKIPDGLRFEFDASHVNFDIETISVNGTVYSAEGDIAQTILLGNLIYDLPITNRWAVALGAGIGGGWAAPEVSVAAGPTGLSKTEAGFAWQLIAGLVYSITPQLDIQVDY